MMRAPDAIALFSLFQAVLYRDQGLLYRDCTAVQTGIAVQASAVLIWDYGACTAMYRDLPYARAWARAHAQERNSVQWVVSRYIAVHAVQNRPRSFPPVAIQVSVHRPVGPASCRSRQDGQCLTLRPPSSWLGASGATLAYPRHARRTVRQPRPPRRPRGVSTRFTANRGAFPPVARSPLTRRLT